MKNLTLDNFKLFDLPCGLKYLWWIMILQVKQQRKITTRTDYFKEHGEEDPRSWDSLNWPK